jgi:paraquat-inducible protein B
MTEPPDLTNLPQAETVPGKRLRLSVVWIIPVLAALVGLGIAIQQLRNEGPTIRIAFLSAEGVEAGTTPIKYKDVEIGKVTGVSLSKDYSRILVTAKMEKAAEGLLVEDARFWVVKPRVTLAGVSGIGTLLSGNYIRFEPGHSANPGREFTGLEVPPSVATGLPGREFVLRADTLGSLGIGSPVYYRRLNVGQVVAYALSPDGKSVDVRIFLNAPFDRLVSSNTRFWEASGIDVAVGANGLSVQTESLLALLVGGVAFDTPAVTAGNAAISDNAVFPLSRDRITALSPREVETERYALYFDESLRGLSVGAPVDFLGLPVGEVTGVFLDLSPGSPRIRARVEIATYPQRLIPRLDNAAAARTKPFRRDARRAFLQRQVADMGLRAQLRSASLISGQLYVALDFFPDAPKAAIDWRTEPPKFPAVPGEPANLQAKMAHVLAKLDAIPLAEIVDDARNAIAALERTLARVDGETLPEAKRALASLDRTLQGASRTMERVDGEIVPETRQTLAELRRAIASAERVLENADGAFLNPDAPGRQDLREAVREIGRAARAIRVLADYLERNPNALLRGKPQEKP